MKCTAFCLALVLHFSNDCTLKKRYIDLVIYIKVKWRVREREAFCSRRKNEQTTHEKNAHDALVNQHWIRRDARWSFCGMLSNCCELLHRICNAFNWMPNRVSSYSFTKHVSLFLNLLHFEMGFLSLSTNHSLVRCCSAVEIYLLLYVDWNEVQIFEKSIELTGEWIK